jgi:hypothetical protein
LVKFLISTFESKYPETLASALILDSPWIFQACWKIIRPWLDPKTANRIIFVTKKDLLDHIDKDQLLEDFGGSNRLTE